MYTVKLYTKDSDKKSYILKIMKNNLMIRIGSGKIYKYIAWFKLHVKTLNREYIYLSTIIKIKFEKYKCQR